MKNLSCNKPVKSNKPSKKKMVKACVNGEEKTIHYGATGYGHNYSAKARKSFRKRHRCAEAKDKLTANYWACKDLWSKDSPKLNPPKKKKNATKKR